MIGSWTELLFTVSRIRVPHSLRVVPWSFASCFQPAFSHLCSQTIHVDPDLSRKYWHHTVKTPLSVFTQLSSRLEIRRWPRHFDKVRSLLPVNIHSEHSWLKDCGTQQHHHKHWGQVYSKFWVISNTYPKSPFSVETNRDFFIYIFLNWFIFLFCVLPHTVDFSPVRILSEHSWWTHWTVRHNLEYLAKVFGSFERCLWSTSGRRFGSKLWATVRAFVAFVRVMTAQTSRHFFVHLWPCVDLYAIISLLLYFQISLPESQETEGRLCNVWECDFQCTI